MLKAYVNMISSAAPAYKGEWQTAPVGAAVAVEDGDDIVRTALFVITPPEHVKIDRQWQATYGLPPEGAPDSVDAVLAGAEVAHALEGVTQAHAHAKAFHQKQLDRLLEAAGDTAALQWHCTMAGSVNLCRIPGAKAGVWKQPKLVEAVHALTGEAMTPILGMPWKDAFLATLTAVRRVQWVLDRRGIAPEITEVAPG